MILFQQIIGFIVYTRVFYFALAASLLWYHYIYRPKASIIKHIVFFPISDYSRVFSPVKHPATLPIVYGWLLMYQMIFMLATDSSPLAGLVFWCLFLLYLCFFISSHFFPRGSILRVLSLIIFSLLICFGFIVTLKIKNFDFMNIVDFVIEIYVFAGSMIFLIQLVLRHTFEEQLIEFFVFFGLLILSFLQIVATIPVAKDFFQHIDIGIFATMIALIFWIISVPWIRHLKCKLSSI